jgi:DNA helicase-2/ATP-dependent DNA helicase PcrA
LTLSDALRGEHTSANLLAEARRAEGVKTQAVPLDHPLLAGGEGALHRAEAGTSIYISSDA